MNICRKPTYERLCVRAINAGYFVIDKINPNIDMGMIRKKNLVEKIADSLTHIACDLVTNNGIEDDNDFEQIYRLEEELSVLSITISKDEAKKATDRAMSLIREFVFDELRRAGVFQYEGYLEKYVPDTWMEEETV